MKCREFVLQIPCQNIKNVFLQNLNGFCIFDFIGIKFNYVILRQNNLLLSDIRVADAAYTFVSRMGPSAVRATVCS